MLLDAVVSVLPAVNGIPLITLESPFEGEEISNGVNCLIQFSSVAAIYREDLLI